MVLPWPEAGAAISSAGQRAAAVVGRVGARQLVVLVGQVVDACQHGVVAGNAGACVQVDQRIAAQHVGVGRVVKAAARGLHFGTHRPVGDARVSAQGGMALGPAGQLHASVQVTVILQIKRAMQLHIRQLV